MRNDFTSEKHMPNRFERSRNRSSGDRVKDVSILIPKIRSEFFARLYTYFGTDPEIGYEGYEFFITDKLTGLEFSAGLTGFGPGYFSADNSSQAKEIIDQFHEDLFKYITELKDCRLVIQNDFGRTILGYENGSFIEIDEEE
jgi:hypothetical protein